MTTPTPDTIPAIASYRGRSVHDFQSESRIREIVCPEIDRVLDRLSEPGDLLTFASDASKSPEARLAAADKLLKPAEIAAAGRQKSPVDTEKIKATVAGLASLEWSDPASYNSLLTNCSPGGHAPAPRPQEYRDALISAQEAAGE